MVGIRKGASRLVLAATVVGMTTACAGDVDTASSEDDDASTAADDDGFDDSDSAGAGGSSGGPSQAGSGGSATDMADDDIGDDAVSDDDDDGDDDGITDDVFADDDDDTTVPSGGAGTDDDDAPMGGNSADGDDDMTDDDSSFGGESTETGIDGAVGDCPPAPDDAPPEAVEALVIVNEVRLPAGAGCITMDSALNLGAKNHCDYYAANSGMCTADPHGEVEGCEGFTGESFADRVRAAGFMGSPAFEVMAFANSPTQSIEMWVNSVWHRTPIISPWVTEMGYGAADGCDTIDFGRGMPAADDVVVVYPYDGQTDVPTLFHGDREGPEPPIPPEGWPSGVPITVYAKGANIEQHVFTIDGDDTPIEHLWLTPEEYSLIRDETFMYGHVPLEAMTTYRVRIAGTYVGGDLNLDWTFTTGEAEPVRGGRN